MVVKRALKRHLIDAVFFDSKAEQLGKLQLETVCFFERNAKETFKGRGINAGAVRGLEQVVQHPLARRETERQRGRKLTFGDSFTVCFDRKRVDLELVFKQGGCRTAEAQKVIPRHGGIARVFVGGEGPDGAADIAL